VFVINWGLVVEGAVLVSPIVLIGLKQLEHAKFVADSTAWTNVIKGAELAVNDISAQLKGLQASGDVTPTGLVNQAVEDLRTVYVKSIQRLGGSTVITDDVLRTILSQVSLPGGAETLINDFFNAGQGAPTLSGANRVGLVLRRYSSPKALPAAIL
jgi:hypothetical protein